jgi:hypothetical protein
MATRNPTKSGAFKRVSCRFPLARARFLRQAVAAVISEVAR